MLAAARRLACPACTRLVSSTAARPHFATRSPAGPPQRRALAASARATTSSIVPSPPRKKKRLSLADQLVLDEEVATGPRLRDDGLTEEEAHNAAELVEAMSIRALRDSFDASAAIESNLDPTLLSSPAPAPDGEPTIEDFDDLEPDMKRYRHTSKDSSEARKKIYLAKFQACLRRVASAFNKDQVLSLVNLLQLDPDVMRPSSPAKRKKWKRRPWAELTKSALVKALVVHGWELPPPESLQFERKTLRKRAMTDREIFLLLAPGGTTMPSLAKDWDISMGIEQDGKEIRLCLTGEDENTLGAEMELDTIEARASKELVSIPHDYPAEVFQALSRLSRTFISPTDLKNRLMVCGTSSSAIADIRALLHSLTSESDRRTSTPLLALSSTHTESRKVAFSPILPVLPAPWWMGEPRAFARVKTQEDEPSAAGELDEGADGAMDAAVGISGWSWRGSRAAAVAVALCPPAPSAGWHAALAAPFRPTTQLSLYVTPGIVAFPVYTTRTAPESKAEDFEGSFDLPELADRVTDAVRRQSAFLASTQWAVGPGEEGNARSIGGGRDRLRIKSQEVEQALYRDAEGRLLAVEKEGDKARMWKATESEANFLVPDGSFDVAARLEAREPLHRGGDALALNQMELTRDLLIEEGGFRLVSLRSVARSVFTLPSLRMPEDGPQMHFVEERWTDLVPGRENQRGASLSTVLEGFTAEEWNDPSGVTRERVQALLAAAAKVSRLK